MGGTLEGESLPIANAMVVEGYGLSSNNPDDDNNNNNNTNVTLLSNVPTWRDVPFSILFWIHMIGVVACGIFLSPQGFRKILEHDFEKDWSQAMEEGLRKEEDITEEDIQHVKEFLSRASEYLAIYPSRIFFLLVVPCCILAFLFGWIGTSIFLKPCTQTIIYLCLVSSVVWTAIILLASAVSADSIFLYIITGLSLVAILNYVRLAWRMVPFAAINLKIALEGIGRNSGIFIVAFVFSEIGFLWVLYWLYVTFGSLAFLSSTCEEEQPNVNGEGNGVCNSYSLLAVFFLLSLYWTSTMIMNTLQVSVAGVMATWCLDASDANGFCSPAISGSLFRSVTFSFGSICLGSLLQAIVEVLRYLIESARSSRMEDNSDGGLCGSIVLCLLDFLTELLGDLLQAFNQWAYVYVGIYGFSYVESGKSVMELLQARGFTAILTDNLVDYVLGLTSFTVGLVSAATAWLLEYTVSKLLLVKAAQPDLDSYLFGPLPHAGVWAALIGFFAGLWVSSVMMNVLKGAVNTLIVCWADSPSIMESQHPVLMRELADTWSSTFAF